MLAKVEIDPNYKGPRKVESFLQKLKGQNAKGRIFSKFTKRWFVLDLNLGTFSYSRKQGSPKTEVSHSISDIISVVPNPRVTQICEWKFAFNVETRMRMYVLYSESVNMHNLWCVALQAVLRPLDRPRGPIDSDVPHNIRDADHIYPDPQNPSGYQDDKYYPNPQQTNTYDQRLPNQDRGTYQEPRTSTKPMTKGGYNVLEEFPSHPDDVDFQPKESDFRTLPPPRQVRDEELYRDNYSDPKRLQGNSDYKETNYREPDPYRREEEVQAFKSSTDIREDPNQIRRERIGEVPSSGSSYNLRQGQEYYQPPKDNYRQPSPIETNQYANPRKSNQNQWGEPSSTYNQPKYTADYQNEASGYRDPYGSKPSGEPVSNFDRSRGQTSYNREEGYGYQEPQRKEIPRYEQRSQFQTEPRNPAYNPLKRDDPYSGSRGYQDSSSRYQNEESYPPQAQARASPYTQSYASEEYQNYPSKSQNPWGGQQDSWSQPPVQKPQKYQEAPSQGLNPQGVDRNWDSWDN
ncbi:unnamed protein product [Blepharisma stoltei]|uniref:PH domain-containing protein n=1 Tax=Blepharisma stoltei TaxID=1481888 RepID=A0AAU9JLD8_9CILI|nr:unnamed protein product [Blepharisma stoltei]